MFEWSDEEKKIFPYSDGMAEVYGDPLEIDAALRAALEYRWAEVCENAQRMMDGPPGPDGRPTRVQRPEPVFLDACNKLYQAAMRAFQLVPFDRLTGKGCTVAMAMRVYNDFVDFRDGLKKKLSESSDLTQLSPVLQPGFYSEEEAEKVRSETVHTQPFAGFISREG